MQLHRVTFWTRDDEEMMELSDDEFADTAEEPDPKGTHLT